jgi:saccharopine dehydrogenase-like NADP-dependent oxidoreductase
MKVLALGGAGRYFRPALETLAASDLVSEIIVAGRSLSPAQEAAKVAGGKARAVQVDASNEEQVAALAEAADLLINVTGPYFKTLMPALRAAIKSGTNYLDYSEDGRTTEEALELDGAARAAGIVALLGMGEAPGLNSLVCRYVCERLDEPQDLTFGWIEDVETIFGDARESLEEIESTGRVSGALQAVLHYFSGEIQTYRDGGWATIPAFEEAGLLPTPEGGSATGYIFGTAEVITLPRHIPTLRSVTALAGLSPIPVNELLRLQARRIAAGEVDEHGAATAFFRALVEKPDRWLAGERDTEFRLNAVIADGIRNGKRERHMTTIRWNFDALDAREGIGTAGPLALAALKILSGELSQRGVLPPEACFEPTAFFEELQARFDLFDRRDGSPFIERSEPLG